MKIISRIALIVLSVCFFVGCMPIYLAMYMPKDIPKSMYSWGDYSSSLYKLKKEPNNKNLMRHKQVLVKIMEDSKENGLRVPPGVYCEYGYILLKEGKQDEALKYFDLEEQTYPESSAFIQRLKLQTHKAKE